MTGFGFTVFRLVAINSPTGMKILQAILDHRSPEEIANLHRTRSKRSEIEKSASVELPAYLYGYLREVMLDVQTLNQRIQTTETELLNKIAEHQLTEQVSLMCTVPGITRMLALRIIAEMGANYYQRYYSAAAFAKAIGVVPSNEVSGGKLLKRRASYGNRRVKFHLLSAAKAFTIHGHGHLRQWYDMYRSRTTFFKATSALARRMAEALWWVLVRQEPYRYWQGKSSEEAIEVICVGNQLVNASTGEILGDLEQPASNISD